MRLARNVVESIAIFMALVAFFGILRGPLTLVEWVAAVIMSILVGGFLGVLWYLYRDPRHNRPND